MQSVSKVIIPCAGLGSRLLPLTAVIPKELLPIGKWPAVFHTIQEAFSAGLKEIILVVSAEKKEMIRHAFSSKESLIQVLKNTGKEALVSDVAQLDLQERITLVEQFPLAGLGHAVLAIQKVIKNEPFCIALPDEHLISRPGKKNELEELLACYESTRKSSVSLIDVPKSDVSRYGIADIKSTDSKVKNRVEIKGCVEKPESSQSPSTLALMGRYLLLPDIWPILSEIKPGIGGEIQLTDAIHSLAQKKGLIGHVFQGDRIDIGHFKGYYECVSHYLQN
jgi:UTP--glucose-1-phosphate uridylyltransferase